MNFDDYFHYDESADAVSALPGTYVAGGFTVVKSKILQASGACAARSSQAPIPFPLGFSSVGDNELIASSTSTCSSSYETFTKQDSSAEECSALCIEKGQSICTYFRISGEVDSSAEFQMQPILDQCTLYSSCEEKETSSAYGNLYMVPSCGFSERSGHTEYTLSCDSDITSTQSLIRSIEIADCSDAELTFLAHVIRKH